MKLIEFSDNWTNLLIAGMIPAFSLVFISKLESCNDGAFKKSEALKKIYTACVIECSAHDNAAIECAAACKGN